ncbi:SDR family NAD(P)-dependent oxidoreductase [Paraburkholderia sabiae]|uniref:SDR family NAD(P)-dependent oxidoreductase n=1 Tax=Paraburkholderia sabiae TaxID=273251 RepID=A0ABU9QLG5_9BURK|nr:SDR family NAD(P)-dependent oxidoreductase [Paraburkholderia sabiae]WJZ79282.1 SDR family NAD(P)-dependent oxidoreductase [Paraburkholderia sabiae]
MATPGPAENIVDADAQAIQLDVTDQASNVAAARQIEDTLGRLNALVNNAAISRRRAGDSRRRNERGGQGGPRNS